MLCDGRGGAVMRIIKCIDKNWKFFRGDLVPHCNTDGWGGAKGKSFYFGAAAEDFDDAGWRPVNLPHDYGIEGDYVRKSEPFIGGDRVPDMETIDSRHFAGGSLERMPAWYRKHLPISGSFKDKRILIKFEGVFRNCSVYVNEHYIGTHESGYTGFYYDISPFVEEGRDNVLAVRVDPTGREGWWYEGCGIYRHVWMIVTEPVFFEQDGLVVTSTPNIKERRASVHICADVNNHLEKEADVSVHFTILDQKGNQCASAEKDMSAAPWMTNVCTVDVDMQNIIVWDVDNPYLYTLRAEIYQRGKRDPIDSAEIPFGIRSIRIDAEHGLFLNDRSVKIKGVCQHVDHAGVGIAVPDEVLEYRMRKIKALGANAVRCSHNPQPAVLDLCDRLGLLAIAETRKASASEKSLKELRDLVRTARNHPCVYCWSIGNEEVNVQFEPEMIKIIRVMKETIRKEDVTRPVVMALVYWDPKHKRDAKDISADEFKKVTAELDIAGFNYAPEKWDDFHRGNPEKPMMNTEAASCSWTRGTYETNTDRAAFYLYDPENKNHHLRKWSDDEEAVYRAQREWRAYSSREFLCGFYVWTAFDYRGEPSPMPYPAIGSQFGLMDYCGFRKDSSYYYESWWNPDRDVLHIFPHWNRQGHEGEPVTVWCYSNMDEVEILVNGKSCGKKTMEKDWFLRWDGVIYEPGTLTAIGYREGRECRREEICTTGAPSSLRIDVHQPQKNGICILDISVLDNRGSVVPTADPEVFLHIDGNGEFIGCGNGDPGSHESDKRPLRRAFHGHCQFLVRPKEGGDVRVTACAEGIGKTSVVLR